MENKKINLKAFTFVELIIVMIIIVILSGIGFSSYVGYISNARDTQRKSDLLQINSALQLYKQKRGYYGFPGNYFNITYSGTVVAMQGKLNTQVHIDSVEKLPLDPKTKLYYTYSLTTNKQEFLIAGTLENSNYSLSLVNGNYKSVSKNILPTILLATGATIGSDVEIKDGYLDGSENRKLFIYDNQEHNLAYSFIEPFTPYTDGISFDDLLSENQLNNSFWQNSDYRNCIEISEAGKLIIPLSSTPLEYQIISETGALVNTGCTL